MPNLVTDSDQVVLTDDDSILIVDSAPAQSRMVAAWEGLYAAQTRSIGIAILATIEGFCVDAEAIVSQINLDDIYVEGPHAEGGGWNIQMRLSDIQSEPPKQTPISCNGEADGHELLLLNFTRNNGIAYIVAADFSSVNA